MGLTDEWDYHVAFQDCRGNFTVETKFYACVWCQLIFVKIEKKQDINNCQSVSYNQHMQYIEIFLLQMRYLEGMLFLFQIWKKVSPNLDAIIASSTAMRLSCFFDEIK